MARVLVPSRIGLVRDLVTVVWRRELGMLVNWADILDGGIVSAARAVASMAGKPRTSPRLAGPLGAVAWADAERLVRDSLAGIPTDPGIPDLSEQEAAEVALALKRHEVHGALLALLTVRLTGGPESEAARARDAVRLALVNASPLYNLRMRAVYNLRTRASTAFLPREETKSSASGDADATRPDSLARWLSWYFDDRIAALSAALEERVGHADSKPERQAEHRVEVSGGQGAYVGDGGIQVNVFREASSNRIEALLGAIERQAAALADPTYRAQAEKEFIDKYRRQAHQRHGFLTPPDFDRRRRVPVGDIYVPTTITEEDEYSARTRLIPENKASSIKVWDLARLLNRTVLLGDPGGGKTTAANVLTDRFASDAGSRIPFLVTLREYAAGTLIEWSVAEYIEQSLRTVYMCSAPHGLVERLLLTGRAVVVFDGLDELLDTSRRRDVSERVEQFCSAYPLTPVLVTSRVVGYDQARLDDSQFSCYRLGQFGNAEVAQYARKWFASQEGATAEEAAAKASAFLAESANAADLRANPLLLSLMCILYRGAGALPGDQASVYAECAKLLLRRWDEQRGLYRKLSADHLVEPTLRSLAWWLFTRDDGVTAVTERELISQAGRFMHGRGFESEAQARDAATEFVAFCRGRMWVFSDAGTDADGGRLFAFTHRTFMEYFAAGHWAATTDAPEDLARDIVARDAWSTGRALVGELAVKLKCDVSDRGADRIYAVLLAAAPAEYASKAAVLHDQQLTFLARCLSSARPSPAVIRQVTRLIVSDYLARRPTGRTPWHTGALGQLVSSFGAVGDVVEDEFGRVIGDMIAGGDPVRRKSAIVFLFESEHNLFLGIANWGSWLQRLRERYASEITASVMSDLAVRAVAVEKRALSVGDALAMPGGLGALLRPAPGRPGKASSPLLNLTALMVPQHVPTFNNPSNEQFAADELAAVGRYLAGRPLPWAALPRLEDADAVVSVFAHSIREAESSIAAFRGFRDPLPRFPGLPMLGLAAVLCMTEEITIQPAFDTRYDGWLPKQLGVVADLHYYLARRIRWRPGELPDLPVPDGFKRVFRDWAERRVDFVEILEEASS